MEEKKEEEWTEKEKVRRGMGASIRNLFDFIKILK